MRGKIFIFTMIIALVAIFLFNPARADERFIDNGDGTVTDTQTGLMWAKDSSPGNISWQDAEMYCKTPAIAGYKYSDWRMPTIEELKTLYTKDSKGYETDCGQRVKTVPEIKLSCGWMWTSETSAIQAFIFNFHRGYHYSDRMVHNRDYRVLPVRDLK